MSKQPTSARDLTDGQRLYAIGDIHGRLDLLEAMLARIAHDLNRRPHQEPRLIFLGDYCDRGPNSREVVERLIALEASERGTTFLLGNHDSYIAAYLEEPDWFDRTYHWLHSSMGGNATLASYGITGASDTNPKATREAFAQALPAAHLAFFERCALWQRIGGYVFAHAGIRPGVPMRNQVRDDLIWIREPFLSSTADFGFKVVHGHTIVPRVEHHPNRIAVDTGAVKHGVLSCVVLEGDAVWLLEPRGPRPLPLGAGLKASRNRTTRSDGGVGFWPRLLKRLRG